MVSEHGTANLILINANVDCLYPMRCKAKVGFLKEIAITEGASIICVTETHLKRTIVDAEVKMEGYSIFRSDRSEGRPRGGVATYVKDNPHWNTEVLIKHSNSFVEILAIHLRSLNLVVVNVYRPPECNPDCFKQSLDQVASTLISLPAPLPEVMVVGDLNFPHMDWSSGVVVDGPAEERRQAVILKSFMDDWCLRQYVDQPTREKNILDVVLCNNQDLIGEIRTEKTTFSDHRWLFIETNVSTRKNKTDLLERKFQSPFDELNFHNEAIDWITMKQELSEIDWFGELEGRPVDEKYDIFMSKTLEVCQRYVPKRHVVSRKHKVIPRDRKRLMNQRAKLRSKMLNCRSNHNKVLMQTKMDRLEEKLKISHDRERQRNELRAVSAIKKNPKYFFKFAKSKSTVKTQIGPLERKDGTLAHHPSQMSCLLQKQYEEMFSEPDPRYLVKNPHDFFSRVAGQDPVMDNLEFGRQDFVRVAGKLRTVAAAGPDGFPAVLLKQCAWELSSPLVMLWETSLRTGIIPQALKKARITPIFKGGRRSSPGCYRPVALTSHVIKFFERLMTEKIVEYLEENSLLNERQHGFRKGRSCLSQLLDHHDRIVDALLEESGVDVIYLDLWKAFDQVDHGLLMHKARALGISGNVGKWLHAFLTQRTQSVIVGGHSSDVSTVISGVPQGSVLGPILFLLLLGDIDAEIVHSMASSFADDTRIAGKIKNVRDRHCVQQDLEKLYNWADENNMAFNSDKFQLLSYGKRTADQFDVPYIGYDGAYIEECRQVKDLGVVMQNDGLFTAHIGEVVSTARNQAAWILRAFSSRNIEVMLVLYKSLVLPRLEYCSVLWSPSRLGDVQALEGVQRTFTSRIPAIAHMNYWERIAHLKLYSVERRRERYTILYVYKIINGIVPNVNNKITTKRHRRHGLLCDINRVNFHGPTGAVAANMASFAGRAPSLFNCLPRYVRETQGYEKFKRALDIFLQKVPDEPHAPQYHRRAASNCIRDQLAVLRADGRYPDRL